MENTPTPPTPPSTPQPEGSAAQPAAPSPSGVTPQDQSWAIGLHLSGFAGFVLPSFGQIVVPLVIWLIKRPESAYLDRVGKEVLNFQISYTIYMFVAAVLIWFCIGIVLLPAVAIMWAVFMVIAAVKTSNGESYQYPFTIRFLQ